MMRIAWRTATRMVGSPTRVTSRRIAPPKSLRVPSSLTIWPVSIRPQVEALTSSDSLRPRCLRQFASPSLSRISLSVVIVSGMRSSASATHISSTPSSLDRSYWRMKDSTTLWSFARERTRLTSAAARSTTSSRSSGGRSAWSSRSLTASVSSRNQAAVMRARAGATVSGSSGLSMGWVTESSTWKEEGTFHAGERAIVRAEPCPHASVRALNGR